MAVELEKLKAAGITSDSLRKRFALAEGSAFPEDEKTKALVLRLQSRIDAGRMYNFANFRLYHAIDLLWETPFRAQDEALLRTLERRDWSREENHKILKDWALSHLLVDRTDPKTNKKEKVLNLPKFLNVVVPLASSATKTRAARLTIDRMQYPLFKFEPRKTTKQNVARCEALTDYVETVTDWFDYRNQLQQNILKCCQYPNQLSFIREAWFKETQAGKLQKEGLRYSLPHPSRTYYDLTFPISSFNTDTGAQFAGYWQVVAYRTLRENKHLWNNDRVAFGPNWLGPNTTFFNTVYPCRLAPWPADPSATTAMDRERAASTFFQTSQDDYGVVTTEHFERIVPSEWGLGAYDDPVWFRFLVASDTTILYAEPLPAGPVQYWGYDPDDARTHSPSMLLEAAPWEYLVANLLSQLVISIRQNLANLTFYNSDVVDPKVMESLSDVSDGTLTLLRMVPMSFRKQRAMQNDVRESVLPMSLPRRETVSIMSAINMAVTLMERCLAMSAQESGSAASHQQSAEEMRVIQASMSTRLEYTGLAIDRAIETWKRQLYYFVMAFGSSEVYAQVSADGITKAQLEKMGFTVDEVESDEDNFVVRGKKDTLTMEYFVSARDGPNRSNNAAIAQGMLMVLQPLAPKLAEAIGPEQVTELFNQWAESVGLPRTFRLRAAGEQGAQQIQAQMQQLAQITAQTAEAVPQLAQQVAAITKQLEPLTRGVVQAIALGKSNQEVTAQLSQLLAGAAMAPQNQGNGRTNTLPGNGGPPPEALLPEPAAAGFGPPPEMAGDAGAGIV